MPRAWWHWSTNGIPLRAASTGPNRVPMISYLEFEKPVAELAAKVDRACVQAGLEPERRAFHPHITIARFNRRGAGAARDFERRASALASTVFRVGGFLLFESHLSRHGPHYEKAAEYPLNLAT